MSASIDDNGYQIGFKMAAGQRISPLASGTPGHHLLLGAQVAFLEAAAVADP